MRLFSVVGTAEGGQTTKEREGMCLPREENRKGGKGGKGGGGGGERLRFGK